VITEQPQVQSQRQHREIKENKKKCNQQTKSGINEVTKITPNNNGINKAKETFVK
jgi:hypothetical protein